MAGSEYYDNEPPSPQTLIRIAKAERKRVWDKRFLWLAENVASWSKDPSTQVGAVIVRPDRTVVSLGFNGFPRGVSDAAELYDNREVKYVRVIHAELNAILSSSESLHGHTIYSTLYPCSRCAGAIIQAGLARVVTWKVPVNDTTARIAVAACWDDSTEMLEQAGVRIKAYEREPQEE